jgi:hypothetical protein
MPHTSIYDVVPALNTEDPAPPYRHHPDQATEPAVTEYLGLADAVTAQFAHYLHVLSQLTATAADETNTATITLNHNGRIEDVWMQPGCKHLGAGIISQRLNEALQTACISLEDAKADIDADHSRKLAALQARIDTGSFAPVPTTVAPDTRLSTRASIVTVSDPAHTVFVTTQDGHPTEITVTAAELDKSTEAELAAKIVAVARFSRRRLFRTRATSGQRRQFPQATRRLYSADRGRRSRSGVAV